MEELVLKMNRCAEALFQNREQEAYQMLNEILPEMNHVLQEAMNLSKEMEQVIASVLAEFIEDFQRKDNLGLADLLGYTMPEIIETIIEGQ